MVTNVNAINRDKVDKWKRDIEKSVDFYNEWFLAFAPSTFRNARSTARKQVEDVFEATDDGRELTAATLVLAPQTLPVLRQMTCPPLARDRLAGLSGVSPSVVKRLESLDRPPSRSSGKLLAYAEKIVPVLKGTFDVDLMPWLDGKSSQPTPVQRSRAALVVADRLCGSLSDPIIRNAQEKRQLEAITAWLVGKGYAKTTPNDFSQMKPGEFAFHLNVNVKVAVGSESRVNIPVDVAIQPLSAEQGDVPIFFEAKSAGDFANVNKRRKEEAQKISQLKLTYGDNVRFLLFLCGYFDSGYLGYEAAEGIDWIWEHRISDMEHLGL